MIVAAVIVSGLTYAALLWTVWSLSRRVEELETALEAKQALTGEPCDDRYPLVKLAAKAATIGVPFV